MTNFGKKKKNRSKYKTCLLNSAYRDYLKCRAHDHSYIERHYQVQAIDIAGAAIQNPTLGRGIEKLGGTMHNVVKESMENSGWGV